MIKIKKIEFIKVVYDESLSHNIFSIANITFSNREPINGALLYWQRNTNNHEYTKQDEYKFFYDMANVQYFASVKFPKYVNLSKEEKQELAYILLEERGFVGSYSFTTEVKSKYQNDFKKEFAALQFPTNFDPSFCPLYIKSECTQMDLDFMQHDYPSYDDSFIRAYAAWRYGSTYLHPERLKPYMSYIDFNYIVATNPYLNDLFLIERLDEVNLELLATNIVVVSKLSKAFQQYICDKVNEVTAKDLGEFIDFDVNYVEPSTKDEQENELELEYFMYDRGIYKWPGSEHMVKGIPSLRSMQFDQNGYKKRTNNEMDQLTKNFSPVQWKLFSASVEPHWLHRYRNQIDWFTASAYNKHLSESFITAMYKYIDFTALGQNVQLRLSETFLNKYMSKFNHQMPQPLIIRNLTETLYLEHKTTLNVNYDSLMEYSHLIEEPRLQSLINLLD